MFAGQYVHIVHPNPASSGLYIVNRIYMFIVGKLGMLPNTQIKIMGISFKILQWGQQGKKTRQQNTTWTKIRATQVLVPESEAPPSTNQIILHEALSFLQEHKRALTS